MRRAATTLPVIDGGYVSALPKHWSLEFDFATTQPAAMTFFIDGKQGHVEHYVPWVCEGDDVPINLAAGDHVVSWAVNDDQAQLLKVSVAAGTGVWGKSVGDQRSGR